MGGHTGGAAVHTTRKDKKVSSRTAPSVQRPLISRGDESTVDRRKRTSTDSASRAVESTVDRRKQTSTYDESRMRKKVQSESDSEGDNITRRLSGHSAKSRTSAHTRVAGNPQAANGAWMEADDCDSYYHSSSRSAASTLARRENSFSPTRSLDILSQHRYNDPPRIQSLAENASHKRPSDSPERALSLPMGDFH